RTETLSTTSTTASEAPQPRRRLRRQVEDEEEPESTSAKDSQETRDQLSDADELSAGEADEPLDAEEIDEAQIARRERQQRRWEEKELGPEFAMSILSKEEFLRFKAQTASKPPPPEPKEALWSRGDEDLSDVFVRLCPNKPRKAGFFGARLSGRPPPAGALCVRQAGRRQQVPERDGVAQLEAPASDSHHGVMVTCTWLWKTGVGHFL
ncbi:unnamed protein product, partial [Effrenium voratum]